MRGSKDGAEAEHKGGARSMPPRIVAAGRAASPWQGQFLWQPQPRRPRESAGHRHPRFV